MNRKKFENYDDFIKKFNKPGEGHKLTTDDCYTPHDVYDVVLDWVINKYNLSNDTKIVRPFYQAVITKNLTTLQTALLLTIRHSQFLQAFVSGT